MMKGANFRISATNAAAPAMRKFRGDLNSTANSIARMQPLQRSWNRGLNSNRRAVQQLGFQMSDFAIQISGGQSALLAFIQQGGQILQFFGAFGAMAAAFLAVFGSLALAFLKSGHAMNELFPLLGVLQDDFAALGSILGQVKEIMIDFANVIVNNLDVILISVGVVAGYFAVKWVASMYAATAATLTFGMSTVRAATQTRLAFIAANAMTVATNLLTMSFKFLRTALIRTGIGALVVAAGYLIERFLALVKGAGGFGKAMKMLGELAKAVFSGMLNSGQGLRLFLAGVAKMIAASFVDGFAWIAEKWDWLVNKMADGWNVMADSKMGEMLGLGKMKQSKSGEGFREKATELYGAAASDFKASGAAMKESMSGAITIFQKIRDLTKETKIDIREWFGGGGGDDKKKGGGSSPAKKAKEVADEVKKVFDDMQKAISGSMMSSFKALLKGTKTIGEAARDILGTIIDKVIELLMTPIFDSIAGGITGGILGGLGGAGVGPAAGVASFAGGGYTGSGVRAGGMDGKGGRLAMLHPDETVIDHTKGQGAGTNVTMTIVTPDAESFRASRRQIERQMAQSVRNGGM